MCLFAASGRLLCAVRGHIVRWRLLPSAQRGPAICGRLQREQEEVTDDWRSRPEDEDEPCFGALLYFETDFHFCMKRKKSICQIWNQALILEPVVVHDLYWLMMKGDDQSEEVAWSWAGRCQPVKRKLFFYYLTSFKWDCICHNHHQDTEKNWN